MLFVSCIFCTGYFWLFSRRLFSLASNSSPPPWSAIAALHLMLMYLYDINFILMGVPYFIIVVCV